jgi:LuxR family maltose regulon positive regulatory protein
LKVTPARVPRDLLLRQRLSSDDAHFRERPVIAIQAPAGFGKTALLAQWRLEHLTRGTVVAWLSAQDEDEPQRFVQSLALAVRVGSARPAFGHTLIEVPARGGLDDITAWLAEVAQSALDVTLMIDETERLPAASLEALTYLSTTTGQPACRRGRPAGPRLGCRRHDHLWSLRRRRRDRPALPSRRNDRATRPAGPRIDADAGARLHELTEGWPLGLQLALSAVARSDEPRVAIQALSNESGDLYHLVSGLLANLEPDDTEFLTRISICDDLHAGSLRRDHTLPDAAERSPGWHVIPAAGRP